MSETIQRHWKFSRGDNVVVDCGGESGPPWIGRIGALILWGDDSLGYFVSGGGQIQHYAESDLRGIEPKRSKEESCSNKEQ